MSGLGFDRPEKPKKGRPITLVDNIRFDDDPTTYTSVAVDALQFRKFILFVTKAVTLLPTTIEVQVQYSPDNVNWYLFTRGPFGYLAWEDTAGTENEAIDGDVPARYLRVYVVAVGTDATNYFDLTVKIQFMS